MPGPIRYRFDISGPVSVSQDLVVRPDGFAIEDTREVAADVVFRGNTGNYILLIFGRLTAGRARQSGRIKIEGVPEQADLFSKMFLGF